MKAYRLIFVVTLLFGFVVLVMGWRGTAVQADGISSPVLKWQNGGCYSSWCETDWYSSPAVAVLDDGEDNQSQLSAMMIANGLPTYLPLIARP